MTTGWKKKLNVSSVFICIWVKMKDHKYQKDTAKRGCDVSCADWKTEMIE